jgi:hypothetical protein
MTKIHDNEFGLNMLGMSDFSFTVSKYHVTEGQPWGGVTSKCDRKGATIIVKAGRDSDGEPGKATAEWFLAQVDGGSAIGCQTTSKTPGGLNFAFEGTMVFKHDGRLYTGTDIVIAQGHTGGSRNNWWLGGPKMLPIADAPLGIFSMIYQPFGSALKNVSFAVVAGQVSDMNIGILTVKAP